LYSSVFSKIEFKGFQEEMVKSLAVLGWFFSFQTSIFHFGSLLSYKQGWNL